jgi:hypothetical protein
VKHPEFPLLTVIGSNPIAEQQTQAALKASNIRLLPQPREETEKEQQQQREADLQRVAAAATAAANTAEVQAAERAEQAAAAAAAATQKAAEAKAAAEQAAAGNNQQKQALAQIAAAAAAQEAAVASKLAEDAAAAARLATEQAAAAAAHYTIEEFELAAAPAAAVESAEAPAESAAQKSAAAVEQPPAAAAPALPGMRPASTMRDMLSMQLGHHGHNASSMVNCVESSGKPVGGSQQQAGQQQQRHDQASQGIQLQLQGNTAALQQQSLLSFDDIRALQTSIGLHLCPSEREGFGHYLNEARAAAALIISTDHPPMNEMVRPEFGVLVRPNRTEYYEEWQSLAAYAKINAFFEPDVICAAVQKLLGLPVEERTAMGRAARKQYLADKSSFVRKMRRLRLYLAQWRQHGQKQLKRRET